MTAILTPTLEQRIASKWTDYQIAKALELITWGRPSAKRWSPAMKRAVRAEAARRLAEGDS